MCLYSGQNIGQNVMNMNNSVLNNNTHSILNYKIVKCKNWEKDHTCKFGAHCTFAHGDSELRNKADNLYQINPSFQVMMPMIMPPQGMNLNQMQQIMMSNRLMLGMGINPNIVLQNNVVNGENKNGEDINIL